MRRTTTIDLVSEGKPLQVTLIQAPNIDDVVISEAQVQAYLIASGEQDPNRRVERSVRELLVRIGVER